VTTISGRRTEQQFGGGAIGVAGNTVSGSEGNGVVEFTGTFTSISFTTTFENFYVFTVGRNDAAQAPEPAALVLVVTRKSIHTEC
jgi:hypothetical protein